MPTQTYYLEGGPCNGKTGDLPPNQPAPATIDCGGDRYKEVLPIQRRNGALVYKDAGPVPQQSTTVTSPSGHGGWRALRVTFNQKMHTELEAAHKQSGTALRILAKARKVRL